ncbi:hypothetical protein EDD71_10481 [Fonticella tunisiensis]|uniref:Uncharacterized protein n=1 Tax=Fonticella tunisiensis TaxID=1096341 RepID=A0A4R7KV19_9CLOT|nr:hypothetical protein EDD71_10481 [Fonticella tunisiensis]
MFDESMVEIKSRDSSQLFNYEPSLKNQAVESPLPDFLVCSSPVYELLCWLAAADACV